MKNIVPILLAVSGIGLVIWLIQKFSSPAARPSSQVNTGSAGALDALYKAFTNQRQPRSTGSQAPDNTPSMIVGGAGALVSTVKGFKDLFGGSTTKAPTQQVISPGIIYNDAPYATSVDLPPDVTAGDVAPFDYSGYSYDATWI